MDDEALRRRFAGTPLLRAKPAGLRRNAAIALANGDSGGHRSKAGADGGGEHDSMAGTR